MRLGGSGGRQGGEERGEEREEPERVREWSGAERRTGGKGGGTRGE